MVFINIINLLMKRKSKQRWPTNPTTTSHLNSLNTKKRPWHMNVGNLGPGLG